jgi:TetR/AcrR family transcriptional repressor of nem operon
MSRTADPSDPLLARPKAGFDASLARPRAGFDVPQRLVTAGLELFLGQGYNATGIQQITDRARVPKGSFYNHFESKEAFAAVVVARYAEWLRRSWTHMMRAAPVEPLASIRHVFEQMIAYHERAPRTVGCLVGNFAAEIAVSSPVCRKNLLAAQLAWRQRLSGLIAKGQAAGEIRADIDATTLSALTWSAWEGALLAMKVEGSTRPLRETTELMLDKIYPPASVSAGRSTKMRRKRQTLLSGTP